MSLRLPAGLLVRFFDRSACVPGEDEMMKARWKASMLLWPLGNIRLYGTRREMRERPPGGTQINKRIVRL